jgi:hypothetical protein
MRSPERDEPMERGGYVREAIERSDNESTERVPNKRGRFTFRRRGEEVCKSQRCLMHGELARWILKTMNGRSWHEFLQAGREQEHVVL